MKLPELKATFILTFKDSTSLKSRLEGKKHPLPSFLLELEDVIFRNLPPLKRKLFDLELLERLEKRDWRVDPLSLPRILRFIVLSANEKHRDAGVKRAVQGVLDVL